MKIVTIVGARPQFVKASALSRQLRKGHQEILVHTGQHYDYKMSGIFFDGLDIPPADVNLNVGSGLHGAQTGAMLRGIEEVLIAEKPDWVLVYGDTNSTLAGALAASKLHLRVAHVEAGLRSFNRSMPEEINRVVADHLSDLLLCPSNTAITNLNTEGITKNVHDVGDIMLEVLNWAKQMSAGKAPAILHQLGVREHEFLVATIHRSDSTDNPEKLAAIVKAFNSIRESIVFPMHPRARKMMETAKLEFKSHVKVVEPLGYLEMIAVLSSARLALTDSGGLQKEAYWCGVPCITLREETEWLETVQAGWNVLVGCDAMKISSTVASFRPPSSRPSLYGEGNVASHCVRLLEDHR